MWSKEHCLDIFTEKPSFHLFQNWPSVRDLLYHVHPIPKPKTSSPINRTLRLNLDVAQSELKLCLNQELVTQWFELFGKFWWLLTDTKNLIFNSRVSKCLCFLWLNITHPDLWKLPKGGGIMILWFLLRGRAVGDSAPTQIPLFYWFGHTFNLNIEGRPQRPNQTEGDMSDCASVYLVFCRNGCYCGTGKKPMSGWGGGEDRQTPPAHRTGLSFPPLVFLGQNS